MNIPLNGELFKTDILTRVYNETEFQFTLDGYVNVSPVSKAFGKRPNDYLRLGRTAEYIAALTNRFAAAGNPVTEENLVVCVTGGTPDKQGTWLHPKLVIDFARWVNPEFALWCDEQIENILKQSKLQFTMPTTLLEAGRLWLAELEAHEETKGLLSEAKQIIHENKPKVTYYDLVLKSEDLMNISQIAKDFEITAQKLNKILHEEGIQYKDKSGIWLLYAKHLNNQYAQTVTNAYEVNGKTHTKLHLKWTQKGRLFIYDTLKARGILPVVEKEVK